MISLRRSGIYRTSSPNGNIKIRKQGAIITNSRGKGPNTKTSRASIMQQRVLIGPLRNRSDGNDSLRNRWRTRSRRHSHHGRTRDRNASEGILLFWCLYLQTIQRETYTHTYSTFGLKKTQRLSPCTPCSLITTCIRAPKAKIPGQNEFPEPISF